jgi:uncharacterized protein YcfJ
MKRLTTLSVLILASGAALASTSYYEADVLESTPVYRVVETSIPHEECWQEEVARSSRSSRNQSRSHTPGLLGAVIGGAIGNAVGHNKSNQRVGAVVGAILGGSIASDITREDSRPTVYYETVEHCKTVYDYRENEKLVGYDVLYSYNNREYSVRMPENPGATVRVRVNIEPVI